MKRNLHLGLVFPLLLAILLASTIPPSVVQADYIPGTPGPHRTAVGNANGVEGSPTPTPQETLPPPTEDINPTDVPPSPTAAVDTPSPEANATEVTPTSTPADSDPTETATADTSPVVLDATPLVVLDSDGNQVSLATNEAADIIAAGDCLVIRAA